MRNLSLSFIFLLVLLVSISCATQNHEFGDNTDLGYPINAEATWKKFMARLLKNIRATRKVAKRELNLPQELPVATVEKPDEVVGVDTVEDINNANGSKINSQSCSSVLVGCSVTATENSVVHNSSSSSVTNSSNSNSNSNSSNGSTSTAGGGTATSTNNSSSSSSSSSGKK